MASTQTFCTRRGHAPGDAASVHAPLTTVEAGGCVADTQQHLATVKHRCCKAYSEALRKGNESGTRSVGRNFCRSMSCFDNSRNPRYRDLDDAINILRFTRIGALKPRETCEFKVRDKAEEKEALA